MTATRYPGFLRWAETRHAAAVLKAARLKAEITVDEVAAATGWSQTKVTHAETATNRMRRTDALLFAGVLGVDPAELGLTAPAEGGQA